MNTIDTSLLTTAAPKAGLATNGSPDAERARVKDLAEQFESMLLSQMLKEMRRGMLSDDDKEEGLGNGAFTDSMDSQLGLALSKTGGLGISEILKRAIDRQVGGVEVGGPERAAPRLAEAGRPVDVGRPFQGRLDGVTEGLAPHTTETGAPAGPITSNFGWRSDPITHQAKFHAGRDIRMAYGQDVRSAAAGTVTFAGERGGYGMTVEVDHGGGMVTRYAHLSSPAVAVGQAVESGQVIASSGNSGRSTGPHLHFEVLEHGRPVDPDTPIQGFARVADLNPERVLHDAGHSIG